ncbi:MAG: hypothetical protein ABI398_12965 [Devosia sp.]
MRASQSVNFEPTGQVLRIPYAVAEHAVLGGLSAAQMRIALVLIAMNVTSQTSIVKPMFERVTGVRLSNADRVLGAIVADGIISTDIAAFDGKPIFESWTYIRGERGRIAGVIDAKLSIDLQYLISAAGMRHPDIEIAADELRRYSSVAGILMRLRIGAFFARYPHVKKMEASVTPEAGAALFGAFGAKLARIERTTADGEVKAYTSLFRLNAGVIAPGAAEVNSMPISTRGSLPGFKVTATPIVQDTGAGPGQHWISVDLDVVRTVARKSSGPSPLAKLGQRGRYRDACNIERNADK